MSATNDNEWYVLGASVQGASHIRDDKPNQDAFGWRQDDRGHLPLMLAIADGHGSKKYFRSKQGAKFAVEIAIEQMHTFVRQITFPVTNYTLPKQFFNEELPKAILTKWQQRTRDDWDQHPVTREEWAVLRSSESAANQAAIFQNPNIPYGATLLSVLVTPSFIFYLQLGDGDIVMVSDLQKSIKLMPGDRRLLANETTSLCSTTMDTIRDDFRTQFHILSEQSALPDLIMVSTDGYSNSFTKETGFLKAGSDILDRLRADGIDSVKKSLPEWLTKTSEAGSGDDISLGLIFPMSALRKRAILPFGPSEEKAESIDIPIATTSQNSPATPSAVGAAASASNSLPGSAAQIPDEPAVTVRANPPLSNGIPPQPPVPASSAQGSRDISQAAPPVMSTSNDTLPGAAANIRDSDVHSSHMTGEVSSVQSTGRGAVLIVSKDRSRGHYTTIGEALQHAHQPHTRVEVHPGTYSESLSLINDVELIAVGETGAEVIIESEVPCLHVQAKQALIKGFKVRGKLRSGLLAKGKGAVDISAGQAHLLDCDITSDSHFCVRVRGRMTAPTLDSCTIHHSTGQGIAFVENAQGAVTRSRIVANQWGGIEITEESNPLIQDCDILNNKEKGVYVWKQATGRLENCHIARNRSTGIEIRQGGNPLIEGCSIEENNGSGIVVNDSGQGTVRKCSIEKNVGHGVEIYLRSHPTIESCWITDNRMSQDNGSGIVISQASRGTITGCTIANNAEHGIEIKSRSAPTISGCILSKCGQRGIVIRVQAAGVIENCDIAESQKSGIFIADDANPRIVHCHIHHGHSNGVLIAQKGRGTLEHCEIYDNAGFAVDVRGGQSLMQDGMILYSGDAKRYAVWVREHGQLKMERCTIQTVAPEIMGVFIQNSELFLHFCHISSTSYCLMLSDNSQVLNEKSELEANHAPSPSLVIPGSVLKNKDS